MDKVKYYYISGVGNIIANEIAQYGERTEIEFPAVASNIEQGGRVQLMISNFVPEFVKDAGEINKKIFIDNNLIILRGGVIKAIEELYINWKREQIRKFTGIVIPGMKPGTKLQ